MAPTGATAGRVSAPRSSAWCFGGRRNWMRSTRSTSSPGSPTPPAPTVVLTMIQERPTPDPATFIGSGKLDELASECARVGRRRRHLRQRADAGAAAAHRRARRSEGDRSHAADPRHLRPPRANARREVAGRAGAAQVSAAAARRLGHRACRGWAAASAPADLAKRNSKPTAGVFVSESTRSRKRSTRFGSGGATRARAGRRRRCRSSRWSATRTPARRRCSIC